MRKKSFLSEFKIQKAERVQKKIKALLSGPTNAGKTMSSLLIAKGLTNNGKVLVIDTENARSSLHVGERSLSGWVWDAVYITPEKATSENMISAIQEAESLGFDAIILDSITHEWEYIKELQVQLGGRYTDWREPMALHNKFVRAILSANIHVITTMRSKMDYVQEENDRGKKVVKKLGFAPQGQQNFPFEVDFHFIVDENHLARMDKTAQGMFTSPPIFHITEETGVELRKFSQEGEPADTREKRKYISRIREIVSDWEGAPDVPSEEVLLDMSLDELTQLGKDLASQKSANKK